MSRTKTGAIPAPNPHERRKAMADSPDFGKMRKQLTDTVGNSVTDVLAKLKDSGIAEQVQSWIGKGENKPVTADQVSQALGPDHLDKIARQTGKTPQQAAQTMADKLPTMVDKLSPDGHLPDPQSIKANMANMPKMPPTSGNPSPATAAAGAATGPRASNRTSQAGQQANQSAQRTTQADPRTPQPM
jgi:uncharacterized protein YidB (DUF937 family)